MPTTTTPTDHPIPSTPPASPASPPAPVNTLTLALLSRHISAFITAHGASCTAGTEASFTLQALTYARSRGPSTLTLGTAARLCTIGGDGLSRYFSGRRAARFRCCLCRGLAACEIGELLAHVGSAHGQGGAGGWERERWVLALPVAAVGRRCRVGRGWGPVEGGGWRQAVLVVERRRWGWDMVVAETRVCGEVEEAGEVEGGGGEEGPGEGEGDGEYGRSTLVLFEDLGE